MFFRPHLFIRCIVSLICLVAGVVTAAEQTLRVAVLENSPPMSYRDTDGHLTGFSAEIIRAVCFEMQTRCELQPIKLEHVLDALGSGEIDIAAVSLLDTPERRARILLAAPYFRSTTLWFAKPGVQPGDRGIRVAAVKGSAQERYARSQGWDTVAVPTNGELGQPLMAGIAQAVIIPMNTALALTKDKDFQALGLKSTLMKAPELIGNASFGINPRRPELKDAVDGALEKIKRNGVYDRINTQFLPFRVH
jgi:ABC-type amino acid transport substrate-binding protein